MIVSAGSVVFTKEILMGRRTFEAVAKMYLNKETRRGNQKSETAQRVLKQMSNRWKDMDVGDIRKPDIADLVDDLKSRKLKNATVNNYLKYLKAVLNFAKDERELIDSVPKIVQLRETPREFYMEPHQVQTLIRFLDPLRADMVEFGLSIGQRNANIRLLRWDQLSEGFQFIRYSRDETKNGKALVVPLNKDARAVLRKRWHIKEELELSRPRMRGHIHHVFFQENGSPFHKDSVTNRKWRRAVELAGLPKGTCFHTLRHTFASWHIRAGTDIKELMEVGGWSSLNSMQRYVHMNNEHRTKVADRISGMVRG
jgi:integrase